MGELFNCSLANDLPRDSKCAREIKGLLLYKEHDNEHGLILIEGRPLCFILYKLAGKRKKYVVQDVSIYLN